MLYQNIIIVVDIVLGIVVDIILGIVVYIVVDIVLGIVFDIVVDIIVDFFEHFCVEKCLITAQNTVNLHNLGKVCILRQVGVQSDLRWLAQLPLQELQLLHKRERVS